MSEFPSEAKSMKTEPGEVTSPPHPSSKKVDGLKRKGDIQDINDSDEDEDDDGDMLEEEEVRVPLFLFAKLQIHFIYKIQGFCDCEGNEKMIPPLNSFVTPVNILLMSFKSRSLVSSLLQHSIMLIF